MVAGTTTGGRGGEIAAHPDPIDADGIDPRELKRLLAALTAMRDGNFRRRMPLTGHGLMAEVAVAFNDIAERQQHLVTELGRVQRLAGREGRHTERLQPGIGEGGWARAVDAANNL